MNYSEINKDISHMIAEELKSANAQFPQFHSYHEAYAVIKEEVEETEEALKRVRINFDKAWGDIRFNDALYTLDELKTVDKYAKETIKEAVQICAMCQKTVDSLTPYQAGTGRAGGEEEKKVVYTYRE